MGELNAFQLKCKEELIKKLKPLGINLSDFRIKESDKKWFSDKEVFIEAKVNKLNIWIYEDGAHMKDLKKSLSFEAADFNNEDDLIEAFTKKIILLLNSD